MTHKLFFSSSRGVTTRLAELFNFVWPAMAGLWNLRWQVQGYADITGKREIDELHERFVAGSGVTSANLKVACLETTWEEQRSQFARFLLFDLCGLYEAWLEDICPKVFTSTQQQLMSKALQCPQSAATGGRKSYADAISLANANASTILKQDFFPVVKSHAKNSWSNIEELLVAFRYFKLSRNLIIHAGGYADTAWIQAANDFRSIPIAKLGFKRQPNAPVVALGERITIDLADVVGLGNIVHRLIVTLDAALCVSRNAETHLLDRVSNQRTNFQFSLSKIPQKRAHQIGALIGKSGFPRPLATAAIESILLSKNLIAIGL